MLRQVIEDVKTQNWFAVALEFLIVVLSIFFALQANNWNEARKDRIDERRLMSRLHGDLELAEELSSRVRGRRLDRLSSIMSASDVIFIRSERNTLSNEECTAVGSSHYFNIPISDLPSLAELISTGRMVIIQDAELRSALVGLQQVKEALEFIIGIQIVGTIDLPSTYPDLIQLESVFDLDKGEVASRFQCDIEKMRANQKYRNHFSANADRYDAYIRDGLVPWSVQLEKVHQLVDLSLGIQHD
jgi:hypothetical protein